MKGAIKIIQHDGLRYKHYTYSMNFKNGHKLGKLSPRSLEQHFRSFSENMNAKARQSALNGTKVFRRGNSPTPRKARNEPRLCQASRDMPHLRTP